MRLGIFGDIHANLPALQTVIAALKPRCEKLFCTGDVVGYGPNPAECIELLQKHKVTTVCGNHDEYTVVGTAGTRTNPVAREVIEWTRHVLPLEHKKWLADLPMKAKAPGGVEIVHASHVPTKRWFYVVDERSAAENFRYQKAPVSFFGHTHFPMIASYSEGLPVRVNKLDKTHLIGFEKFFVNVGSVGQPRDGDPRTVAVIYDTKTCEIEPIRIAYDQKPVLNLMKKLGFSEYLIKRLEAGR